VGELNSLVDIVEKTPVVDIADEVSTLVGAEDAELVVSGEVDAVIGVDELSNVDSKELVIVETRVESVWAVEGVDDSSVDKYVDVSLKLEVENDVVV
jgi:hypothetical protein